MDTQWRSFPAADHGQKHLETLHGLQCVRVIGGHDDAVTCLESVRGAVDADLDLAVKHLHKGIEVCRVLGESLPFVEGEKRDVAGSVHGHLLADDGTRSIVD